MPKQICQQPVAAYTSQTETHLEETRFALEQFLSELDKLVAQKILATLPTTLGEMKAVEGEDEYTGSANGVTGLFVSRTFRSTGENPKEVVFTIMNESPLLAGITGFLANPLIAKLSGRKMIKLDGYKCALEKEETAENPGYNLYLPFNQSLLSMDFSGFDSETEVVSTADQLPIGQVIDIAE